MVKVKCFVQRKWDYVSWPEFLDYIPKTGEYIKGIDGYITIKLKVRSIDLTTTPICLWLA